MMIALYLMDIEILRIQYTEPGLLPTIPSILLVQLLLLSIWTLFFGVFNNHQAHMHTFTSFTSNVFGNIPVE